MYWWRIFIFFFGVVVFGWGYLAAYVDSFDNWYNSYTDSSLFLSLSLLIVSLTLFFISDSVFKKWLRFAIIWIVLAVMFIILSPEYQGGWLGLGPEKESVSIWMSSLFVIISLVKIAWDVRREKVSG